jgi:hypothetical protein
MNTTELLAVIRQEVYDTVVPYLWADSLIYTYIDDAQKQFTRLVGGIEDSRSFKLTIKSDGTVWYALDPMISKLRDAIDPATGSPIALVAIEKMQDNGLRFDGTVGPLKALITGMEKGYVRALPTPNVASTAELRTYRLANDVAAGDEFEIDQQHILNLGMWVKYRMYGVQDAETRDDKKAATNKADFESYCAEAKKEAGRLRRPVSTVTYGGI